MTKVWQSIGLTLIEHIIDPTTGNTLCWQEPHSTITDPDADPAGTVDEPVWYSDHDVPAERITVCRICDGTEV